MPNLKELLICISYSNKVENRIISLKDLRKASWPTLTRLPIEENLVSEACDIGKIFSRKLEDINIESYEKKGQCCDVSWVAKLESSDLKYLSNYKFMKKSEAI